MIRLPLFICVLLIGLSIVMAKSNWNFRGTQQGRLFRNNGQMRTLRNLMGNLIDTDTNTIYKIEGQKQQDIPINPDMTTTNTVPIFRPKFPQLEETACIAACHSCVEDESLAGVSLFYFNHCVLTQTSFFRTRKKQRTIVVQCVIVLTAAFSTRLKR